MDSLLVLSLLAIILQMNIFLCSFETSFLNSCCSTRDNCSDSITIATHTFKLQPIANLPECLGKQVAINVIDSDFVSSEGFDSGQDNFPFINKAGDLRYEKNYYKPKDYCLIGQSDDSSFRFKICQPDCNEENPCIRKCCPLNSAFDIGVYRGCRDVKESENVNWKPRIYSDATDKAPIDKLVHFQLSRANSNWNCSYVGILSPTLPDIPFKIKLLKSGHISYKKSRFVWKEISDSFCIDGETNFTAIEERSNVNLTDDKMFAARICFDGKSIMPQPKLTTQTYYISMIIAGIFSLVTMLIYLALWDEQKLHGWLLISYFSSLALLYFTLATTYILSAQYKIVLKKNSVLSQNCQLIAIGAHFCFLQAFCWMSIVSFNVWLRFKNFKSGVIRTGGVRRYITYALFAVGIPATFVCFGMWLDYNYGDEDSDIIVPEYGRSKCFISLDEALFPFLYGPIGIILFCNFVLFMLTIRSINIIKQASMSARRSTTSRHPEESPFIILKLLITTGLPWIIEVISWAINKNRDEISRNDIPWYLVVLDLIPIVQGVLIFIIFACKRHILRSLRSKYSTFDKICLQIDPIIRRLKQILCEKEKNRSNNTSFSSNGSRSTTVCL